MKQSIKDSSKKQEKEKKMLGFSEKMHCYYFKMKRCDFSKQEDNILSLFYLACFILLTTIFTPKILLWLAKQRKTTQMFSI